MSAVSTIMKTIVENVLKKHQQKQVIFGMVISDHHGMPIIKLLVLRRSHTNGRLNNYLEHIRCKRMIWNLT